MAIQSILRFALADLKLTFECLACGAVSASLDRVCPGCREAWTARDTEAERAAKMVERGTAILAGNSAELRFALRFEIPTH